MAGLADAALVAAGAIPATHEHRAGLFALAIMRLTRESSRMVSRDPFGVFIAVYMMASRRHGTIYIGVTSELPGRVFQHREGLIPGFTKKYRCHRLVWYEAHDTMVEAIRREKSLKKYKREWKINLIERENPFWDDLYPALIDNGPSAIPQKF